MYSVDGDGTLAVCNVMNFVIVKKAAIRLESVHTLLLTFFCSYIFYLLYNYSYVVKLACVMDNKCSYLRCTILRHVVTIVH